MFATIVVVIAAVAALAYRRYRRHRVMALAWPKDIGLQKLVTLVDTYLEHQGWTIFTPPGNIRIKVITKGDQAMRLVCLPSMVEYHGAFIKDIAETALEPGHRPLIGITTIDVPRHLRSLAAGGQVLLLHYKNLDLFAAGQTDTIGTMNAMCTALLERKEPIATPRKSLFQ